MISGHRPKERRQCRLPVVPDSLAMSGLFGRARLCQAELASIGKDGLARVDGSRAE